MQNFMEAELTPHNHLVNWSNTHECHPKRYYEPESVEELERIVAEAHEKGKILLCTGPGAHARDTTSHGCEVANASVVDAKKMDITRTPVMWTRAYLK